MTGLIAVSITAIIVALFLLMPDPNDAAYDEDFAEQYAKRRGDRT